MTPSRPGVLSPIANRETKEKKMLKNVAIAAVMVCLVLGIVACGGQKAPEAPKAEMPKPAEQAMTDTEKAEFVAANCICATCPSFLKEECEKAGEKGAYCLVGKSKVITKENGCVCPQCPVTAKMALKWGYYCTRGSAKEMMAMEAQGGGGK